MIKKIKESDYYQKLLESESSVRIFYSIDNPDVIVTEDNMPSILEGIMVNYFKDKEEIEKFNVNGLEDLNNQDIRILTFHEKRLKNMIDKNLEEIYSFIFNPKENMDEKINEIESKENFNYWFL